MNFLSLSIIFEVYFLLEHLAFRIVVKGICY